MSAKAKAKPKPRPGLALKPKQPPPPAPLPPGTEELLDTADVCRALKLSERTFRAMLAAGAYPMPDTRMGPLLRWRVATHNRWVRERCGAATGKDNADGQRLEA